MDELLESSKPEQPKPDKKIDSSVELKRKNYEMMHKFDDMDEGSDAIGSGGSNPFDDAMTMAQLIAMPPKEWLVENIIGAGDLGMIYGASGCGKTFVVIDLIGAMITGEPFANRFNPIRKLNVGYCAGEGVGGLPARFRAMIKMRNINENDVDNFYAWDLVPQLHVDRNGNRLGGNINQFVESYARLQGEGKRKQLDVLFIDTKHSASVGAGENDSGEQGVVIESCKKAAEKLGCAVIMVHHTGKNGDDERGSSAQRGAMDTMILIKRIRDGDTKASMQCSKLKDDRTWNPQNLDLVESGESVAVWWDEPSDGSQASGKGDGDRDAIMKVLGDGAALTGKAIGQAIGLGESKQIYTLLQRLEADGKITRRLQDEKRNESNRNPWVFEIKVPIGL